MTAAATVVAAVLGAAAPLAQAQSISNGQVLYNKVFASGTNSCAASSCHGSNPSRGQNRITAGINAYVNQSAVSSVGDMRFLASHLSVSDYNDLAAYIANASGGTATYIPVATAPAVTLSASTVAFGSVTLGQTSSTRTVSLTNSGTAALTISAIARSGSTAFASSHDCPISPATLAAGSSCTLSLTFAPTAASSVTGSVSVTSDATGSPHSVALTGTGSAAAVAQLQWSGTATSLSFTSTVGTAAAEQTLTLANQGSASGTLSAVTLSGANASDFSTSGSCGAGVTLAAGATCTVVVGFDPAAAGSRSAQLQVTSSNAANPAAVSLSGTATADSGTPATGGTSNANVGGGGCSVAPSGRPFDPVLLLLVGVSAVVLAWRQLRRRR